MEMLGSKAFEGIKDARPILPVSDGSLWELAAQRRDDIASRIENGLVALGFLGWVRKSQQGEYPLYVAVDVWRKLGETTRTSTFDRSHLKITIHIEPFKTCPTIYTAEVSREKKYTAAYWAMPDVELDEMVKYLVAGGRKPAFFKSKIPWIVRLLPLLDFSHEYENKLLEEAKPRSVTGLAMIGWIGVIAMIGAVMVWSGSADTYDDSNDNARLMAIGLGVIGAGIIGVAAWLASRRPVYHAVAKQPIRTPRREYLVDSWQVSVPEAGREFDAFKRRIIEALEKINSALEFSSEIYQSQTPRGFEQRERLVITKGQGNVHVHIQPFGRDAFVGWDSFLNWARWSETAAVSTVVRGGSKIEYKSLNAGAHVPSKFDLMELGALAETTHRNIVREIKAFLNEKEIEADLDFQIIRGDRNRALTEGNDEKTKKQKKQASVAAN